MLFRKLLLAALLFALAPNGLLAQNKLSIENIRSVSLRNSGTIMSAEEVKGYFFYYVSDKVDRKTNEYTIQILDEHLKEVRKIVFQDDKDELLLETSYNNNSLLFMFMNRKERTITSKIYGLDGKLAQTYTKELDKRSMDFFNRSQGAIVNDDEGQNKLVFDIESKGYLSVIPVRDGKEYTFEISIAHSDSKKQLNYTPDYGDYKYAAASYLGTCDNVAVFEVLKKEKLMSNKLESSLLGINVDNGKKLFDIADDATKYKFLPLNISALNGSNNILLMGTYYDKDDRVMKNATMGIAAITIDGKGKIINQKYNSWSGDFGKYFKVDAKGKLDDIGYVYFHKIIQTEDGDIYAIGEGYKRVASGGGIALAALSAAAGGYNGNNSVTRLNITDMVIIQFSQNFDVKNATVYEKNKNKFQLPGGDYTTPHLMAAAAKAMGAYDYEFTRTDAGHSSFHVGFNDYERGKDYKGMVFRSISYSNGKLTTDRLELASSASSMRVLPAKTGFILLSEYFKKDRRIDLRMEKMN
jgi:hypothetical protein